VADVTSIPAALRKLSRFLPLKPGTKQPAIPHAVLDSGQPWTPDTDKWLQSAPGMRVGIFMGGIYVVLDADVKWAWEDDGTGTMQQVLTHDGKDNLAHLLAACGLEKLPRTVVIRTQGGGTHWYFLQHPECHVQQKRIGFLDIKAAPNGYCAIGAGYEVIDDGGGEVAVLPVELARILASPPSGVLEQAEWNGHREGLYGNVQTAFNNALTTLKGKAVELGWTETEANEIVIRANEISEDPIKYSQLEGTVLRDKGWQPGQRVTDDEFAWARQQTGLAPDEDDQFLDVNTVKRLWTSDRYRQFQEMEALEPPAREHMADVISEPPPEWMIAGLMAPGLYGLAGPQEAGKSLLVRDWANAVANGTNWSGYKVERRREVSYVISEGHFDLDQRFTGISMDDIYIFRTPVMLSIPVAVDYFIRQHDGHDTGLVIFDIIYHMGLGDENQAKDVKLILGACRKISLALNASVIVVGHPGHRTGRRFRGSAAWRNLFDGDFFMGDGVISCEKHKYARKETMEWDYEIEWPRITFLSAQGVLSREARKMRIIDEIAEHPTESARSLAVRLAPVFDASEITVRRMILDIRKSFPE
jgi:AAA domain/Bifunctional DNA primase/polymerase, N-terminal